MQVKIGCPTEDNIEDIRVTRFLNEYFELDPSISTMTDEEIIELIEREGKQGQRILGTTKYPRGFF